MPNSWKPCLVALVLSATTKTTFAVDNSWHPPEQSAVNDLDRNLGSDGVFDFIFDSSLTPDDRYGQYNYCNMPHVRRREYPVAPDEYELVYVEIIHRHHKRTPYQSNTFPVETDIWYCDDARLYHYGQPSVGQDSASSSTFWQLENTAFSSFDDYLSLFSQSGFPGTCMFPQITGTGLHDSRQHGHDLFEVYHDLLRFLPDELDPRKMEFRVTNNVITSEVAGMVIAGMYGEQKGVPLHVQRTGIDSLEPQYPCPSGQSLFDRIRSFDESSIWQTHLEKTKELISFLDTVSGIRKDAEDWHTSYDHYFDNLSSRLCHSKPLPCKQDSDDQSSSTCITRTQANSVFRLGQWEYSRLYRDAPSSLITSVAMYGVFIAELAQHLREQIMFLSINVDQTNRVLYRHNVAHDVSISRILSILQIKEMVWPGMGAEIAFELYQKKKESKNDPKTNDAFFVRVLWGGQVLQSSNPELGSMEFLDVHKLLDYFDSLVGQSAESVVGLCLMN